MPKTATRISNIGRVMVAVSDQDEAIDFYVEKLGFEKRADTPYGENDSERWVEVAPPGSEAAIALVPPRGDAQPGGWTAIALSTSDIDEDYAALKDRGVDVDPEIMRGGGAVPPMFWFRDQDRNVLLLVENS
jgi:catechol 2,3-dioxygenase-like lactoylglutathione lyase family enzyme